MKKIILLLYLLTYSFTLEACFKQSSYKPSERELPYGIYISDDNYSWLEIEADYQYRLCRNMAVSWMPTGRYNVQKNTLILYLEDDEFAFFIISEDDLNLTFQSDIPEGLSLLKNGKVLMKQ